MTSASRSLNEQLIRAVVQGDAIAVHELLAQGADASTTGGVTLLALVTQP